jgi:hypothetical protein
LPFRIFSYLVDDMDMRVPGASRQYRGEVGAGLAAARRLTYWALGSGHGCDKRVNRKRKRRGQRGEKEKSLGCKMWIGYLAGICIEYIY